MVRVQPIVFLVDVDNTLLDNDGIQQDLKEHLERAYGRDARDRQAFARGLHEQAHAASFVLESVSVSESTSDRSVR